MAAAGDRWARAARLLGAAALMEAAELPFTPADQALAAESGGTRPRPPSAAAGSGPGRRVGATAAPRSPSAGCGACRPGWSPTPTATSSGSHPSTDCEDRVRTLVRTAAEASDPAGHRTDRGPATGATVVRPRITITNELAERELTISGSAVDRHLARLGPNRRRFLDRLPYRSSARGGHRAGSQQLLADHRPTAAAYRRRADTPAENRHGRAG